MDWDWSNGPIGPGWFMRIAPELVATVETGPSRPWVLQHEKKRPKHDKRKLDYEIATLMLMDNGE